MIATPEQEISMDHLADTDCAVLDTILQALREEGPKWTQPPSKLDRAMAAVLAGRVEPGYPEGLYHVQGTQGRYTVTHEGCTCPHSQKSKSKYCAHMAAVELFTRWQEARHGSDQAPLFASALTIDERLAAEPEETIDFTTGALSPTEEDTVSPETIETVSTAPEMPLEAPRMVEAPSMPVQVLRLTPRPISAIVADLSRPLPPECVGVIPAVTEGGRRRPELAYLPWHTVVAVLDAYAPGWSGQVVRLDQVGSQCVLTYRISIPCAEGIVSREATGNEADEVPERQPGDTSSNAEAMAFKRAAAKFGVGRWLYDTKEHTGKFAAQLRKEREDLLQALGAAADAAGIPRATLSDWLKRETGRHRNADIPAWALRDALLQLQALATASASSAGPEAA